MNTEKTITEIAQKIDDYVYNISILEDMLVELNSPMHISPLSNFRDVINHYREMYEHKNNKNTDIFIQEKASIDEHLARGIKDTLVYLCLILRIRCEEAYNKFAQNQYTDDKRQLLDIIDQLSFITLNTRLGSNTLRKRNFDAIPAEITTIIKVLKLLFRKWNIANFLKGNIETV